MDRTSNGSTDPTRASQTSRVAQRTAGHHPPSTSGVFDYAISLQRMGGDEALFDEVLQIFLEDAPPLLEQASNSLASGDLPTVQRAAHTLKGLAANFTAASAVAAAYAVELHARENRLDSASNCFAQLESEVARLEAALKAFRQQR